MIHVPPDKPSVLKLALDLIEICRVSQATRAQFYSLLNLIMQSGRANGDKALINLMYKHVDRTAAHLFSPVELKFALDFEWEYDEETYKRGAQAAKTVTRQWSRQRTDKRFARGVFDGLSYGCALHKQWPQLSYGDVITYHDRLVMPWQFGVFNEAVDDINEQLCLLETNTITMPEVWRRISNLPDARTLYNRIATHAATQSPLFEPTSYFNQLLSTSQINTTGVQTAQRPGGIITFGQGPNYMAMQPRVDTPTVNIHELWVQDDEDYTTIIMIEPDIIVAPYFKKENLLASGSCLQPYRKICPNETTNWFWGRPEIIDLIEPQNLLADWCEDTKRLQGMQVDKILAFIGTTKLDDRGYGNARAAGYFNLEQGEDVKDLTPHVAENGLPVLKWLVETISMLGGFPPIMQGQGEPGVRAGSHADKLTKNASPTLRDRALVVESQCEDAADLTLAIREAKDPKIYWTKGKNSQEREGSEFMLSDLPDDWRVTVDSHSSSPIFSDENQQLVFAAHQRGIVDGEYVIDNVALPNKSQAKVSLAKRQEQQAQQLQQLMQTNPELGQKLALKQITGGKR